MIFFPDGNVSDGMADSYISFVQGHEESIDDTVEKLFGGAYELGRVDGECDPSLPSINSLLTSSVHLY